MMLPLLLLAVFGAVDASSNRQVFSEGDIILGGLFPLHEAGQNAVRCGRIKADQGVQRMQAMLFALDHINANRSILPGIRLGAQILDTWFAALPEGILNLFSSLDTHALEQSLEFIKSVMRGGEGVVCADGSTATLLRRPISAVIGAASSQVSVMVASMLQLFKVMIARRLNECPYRSRRSATRQLVLNSVKNQGKEFI
jgi:hypothetical protein